MRKSAKTGMAVLFTCCCITAVEAKTISVAADGTGDFKTIQEAIAAVTEKSTDRTIIRIRAGTYQGPFVVPKTKTGVTLQGEAPENTILTYDKNASEPRPEGAHIFNPGLDVMGNDFHAEKLTIRNTSGDHGQALAIHVAGERFVFENCRILGWQDTLLLDKGRYYFKSCYIEGRVDFIYGEGTGVFEDCEIHSKNGGYVTAASTKQDIPYGLVFLGCNLTGDPNPWVDPATGKVKSAPDARAHLGRPWGPFGQAAFINCVIGNHIRPEGWHNWGKAENEKTARYVEFGSRSPDAKPLDVTDRVPWAKQLTTEEAAHYTVRNVLGGKDNWDPTAK